MIISITSEGNSSDNLIDRRFGRCSCFAFYNTDDKSLTFIENPNKNVEEGAGPASVSFLVNKNVEYVISGEFGIKVKNIFNELKIKIKTEKDRLTIKQVIQQIEEGFYL